MKNINMLCVIALSLSSITAATVAFAANGDCTTDQLIQAVQKKCGDKVKYTGGHIGHYQGEVQDSYIIPMKDGSAEKNMELTAEGGNCVEDYIGVVSECP